METKACRLRRRGGLLVLVLSAAATACGSAGNASSPATSADSPAPSSLPSTTTPSLAPSTTTPTTAPSARPSQVTFTLNLSRPVPSNVAFQLKFDVPNTGQDLFAFCTSQGDMRGNPCAPGGVFTRSFSPMTGTGTWEVQRVVNPDTTPGITVIAHGTVDLTGDAVQVSYP